LVERVLGLLAVAAGEPGGAISRIRSTRILEHPDGRVGSQPFGYHQVPLWLTNDEAESMSGELSAVVRRYLGYEPAEDRTV